MLLLVELESLIRATVQVDGQLRDPGDGLGRAQVLREFAVVLVSYLLIGKAAPWRSFWFAAAFTAVGLGTCWLTLL